MNAIFITSSSSPQTLTPFASLHLRSPKPRTKRLNRLRPKLPKTLTLSPIPPLAPSPPSPPAPEDAAPVVSLPARFEEADKVAAFEEQYVEQVVGVGIDAPARSSWLPEGIGGLVLRFLALIAVQTAVAVWFYGGGNGVGEEEGKEVQEDQGKEVKKVLGTSGEVIDFETKVLEIRAMARDAREKERRDLDGASGSESEVFAEDMVKSRKMADSQGVSDQIGRLGSSRSLSEKRSDNADGKTNGRRTDYKRKIGYLNSIAKISAPPKGFSNAKSSASKLNGGIGRAKQIQDSSSVDDVALHHEPREPREKIDGIAVSSSLITSESVNGNLATSVNSTVVSSGKQHRISSTIKECHQSHVKEIDASQSNAKVKPWWLKLSYVLAIFLRRGIKHEDHRGLYSLQMGGSAEQESAVSYTVVFQDRGDATNFCYLLESFFEDLSDVTTDIVPMTIKELYKAVESKELNVLVVRKGQLNLYAGQPLTEVETVLRSMVH